MSDLDLHQAHDAASAALEKMLDVSALTHTTKGWIYQNGLHRPPATGGLINASGHLLLSGLSVIGPLTIQGAGHPVTIQNSFFQGGGAIGGITSFAPPASLPVEKREMPVVGYRSWKFKPTYCLGFGRHGRLVSLNETFGVWKKGINKATCKAHGQHRAANQHCGCGFYVLAGLDEAEGWAGGMTDETIVGAVMGWGQVVQHGAEGWRAECARIIGLLDCKFSEIQNANTKAAADYYDLQIYSRAALEACVAEWGDPLETPSAP